MPPLRRARSLPPSELATFTSPAAVPARYRVLHAELRCYLSAQTFGALLDNLETIVRRVERVDWGIEQPRRGRPPRWLVALRARQDAA